MSSREHKWFIEQTSPATAHMFAVTDYLVTAETRYQRVEIADTSFYGRLLVLDGKIQSSEFDEYIYHEALVHPAMLMHPSPRRVLVIGGGEGATLREIFRHPLVERAVMVDIDEEVVDLCREHLPGWHCGSFDDPRLEVIYKDARRCLEESDTVFDVIIGDLPEPVEEGPARRLFTRQFYQLVRDRLAESGILAMQAGDLSLAFMDAHSKVYNTVRQVMTPVYSYRAYVPSFNTDWGFILAARDVDPDRCFDAPAVDRLIGERELELKFYDGETHRGMFAIPRDIRRRRDTETTVIDDECLLTIY